MLDMAFAFATSHSVAMALMRKADGTGRLCEGREEERLLPAYTLGYLHLSVNDFYGEK